ncbi:MAG: helix-turn-helix domain-containing protein [bacterium]|nr:helix-turn-helix domain-containing protein [bacterium]
MRVDNYGYGEFIIDRGVNGLGLGDYLRIARESLRLNYSNVTNLSSGEISQNYLAQLENDRIKQPSIRKLHMLSAIYGIPFYQLLHVAGYLSDNGNDEKEIAGHIVEDQPLLKDALDDLLASMPEELDAQERKNVLVGFGFASKYIKIVRSS